jgi:hypothetical protein
LLILRGRAFCKKGHRASCILPMFDRSAQAWRRAAHWLLLIVSMEALEK